VARGLSVLDLVVVLAVLGLLVWAVRLDWQRSAIPPGATPPAAVGAP
jgi:hypothetical protein